MSLLSIPLKHFEIKEDLEITVQFKITLPWHFKSEKSVLALKVGPFR